MDDNAPERKSVRVTVFNQTVTLSTAGDPRELEEAAQMVDELVRGIASRTGNADAGRATLLACLHIADQLRTIERELQELRDRVSAKHREFRDLLDQVVES